MPAGTEVENEGKILKSTCYTQFVDGYIEDRWPRDMRGHIVSPNPVGIGYGINSRWGGAAGFGDDYFNGGPQYSYAAKNITLSSPRMSYRSVPDPEQTSTDVAKIILVADPDDEKVRFNFNTIAAFNSNIGNVRIRISDDKLTWTALGGTHITYIARIRAPDVITFPSPNRMRVFLGGGSAFPAFMGQYDSSTGHPYYVEIKGTITRCFKILETVPSAVGYDIVLETFLDMTLFAAVTEARIYTGRWLYRDSSPQLIARYIEITGDNEVRRAVDQYLEIGTLVIGTAFDLPVPFEWTMTNNEQPNITNYKTKGGLAWSFVEGPPQRTFTNRIVGDVHDRERESIRQLLRSHTQYEHKPVVLVFNDEETNIESPHTDPENVILGRVTSGSSLANAAWYKRVKVNSSSSTEVWRMAGDLAITIEEEV
jgi:hypothetical protein